MLPDIWKNIQTTKSWYATGVKLTKWFAEKFLDEDVDVQFHKELVDDIRKLMFSLGSMPLAANAHRGIAPFRSFY